MDVTAFGRQLFEAYGRAAAERDERLHEAARAEMAAELGCPIEEVRVGRTESRAGWAELNDVQRELWEATAEQFAIGLAMQQTKIVRRVIARVKAHKDAIEAAGPVRTPDTAAAVLKHDADAQLWAILELGA